MLDAEVRGGQRAMDDDGLAANVRSEVGIAAKEKPRWSPYPRPDRR